MQKENNLEFFEQVLIECSLTYRGYAIERIAKPIIHDIIFRNPRFKIKSIWPIFISRKFSSFPKGKCEIFMTFPEELYKRADYREISNFVKKKLTTDSIYHHIKKTAKFYFSFRTYFLVFKVIRRVKSLIPKKRFMLWLSFLMIVNAIDQAEKEISIKPQKYFSFWSVLWIENLLTQFFNKRGIDTYNLQHGLIFYQIASPLDNLQHTSIESKYHLSWGAYTRDELLKHQIYSPEVLVAGYPKKFVQSKIYPPESRLCMIFLARRDYEKENTNLLLMLLAYNKLITKQLTFIIKLHPSLENREYYTFLEANNFDSRFILDEKDGNLCDLFLTHNPGFCISVNSTTYFESYLNGVVSLRYHSKNFDPFFDLALDVFSNQDELSRLINQIYFEFPLHFDQNKIHEKLNYVLGCDIDQYDEILN